MGRRKALTDAAIAALPSKPKPYSYPDPELSRSLRSGSSERRQDLLRGGAVAKQKKVWHTIGAWTLYGSQRLASGQGTPSRPFGRGGAKRGLTTLKPSQKAGSNGTSKRRSSSAHRTSEARSTGICSRPGARVSSPPSAGAMSPSCSTPSRTRTVPSSPTSCSLSFV